MLLGLIRQNFWLPYHRYGRLDILLFVSGLMGLPQEYQIYPAVSRYGMRKVILDMLVTLNVFFEGPNGELDWTFIIWDEEF